MYNEHFSVCPIPHITCQFGHVFSHVSSKLISIVPSLFTSAYVLNWASHFPHDPLQPRDAPSFDARATPYPMEQEIRDYLSWRQEDC